MRDTPCLILTPDEAIEAEQLIDMLEHSLTQRRQIAAELAYMRGVFSAAKRDRHRLPVNTQRQVDRWPRYARHVVFDRPRPPLELMP